MAAFALDDHVKIIAGSIDASVHRIKQADAGIGAHMHAIGLRHILQNALFHHKRGAAQRLFRRLKNQPHRAAELIAMVLQQLRCAKQHRRVAVMPARVHHAVVL